MAELLSQYAGQTDCGRVSARAPSTHRGGQRSDRPRAVGRARECSPYKLAMCAEKRWRRIRGFNHLAKVITAVKIQDGIEEQQSQAGAPPESTSYTRFDYGRAREGNRDRRGPHPRASARRGWYSQPDWWSPPGARRRRPWSKRSPAWTILPATVVVEADGSTALRDPGTRRLGTFSTTRRARASYQPSQATTSGSLPRAGPPSDCRTRGG